MCKMYYFVESVIRTSEAFFQEQYLFVYDALLEALKAGNTAFGCSEFRTKYEELRKADSGHSKLYKQFQVSTSKEQEINV